MDIVELPYFVLPETKSWAVSRKRGYIYASCTYRSLSFMPSLLFVFCHFTLVKNGSIGHWACCCGKRMMVVILKPLNLWESVLSLIITMAWTTTFAYMLHDSTSRLMVLKHLSLTLTVEHILLKCCPHVLGKLLPCVHHTCTRVRIDIYIPVPSCAYICMDVYTNMIVPAMETCNIG